MAQPVGRALWRTLSQKLLPGTGLRVAGCAGAEVSSEEHPRGTQTSSRHVPNTAVLCQTADSVATCIETVLMLLKMPEHLSWAVSCMGPEPGPPPTDGRARGSAVAVHLWPWEGGTCPRPGVS